MSIVWRFGERRRLRNRWRGEERRAQVILSDIVSGLDWTRRLLADPAQGWKDLPFHGEISSLKAESAGRDLRGIDLRACDLTSARLTDTHFEFAELAAINFTSACLVNCTFDGAVIAKSSFREADLSYSSFRDGWIRDSTFEGATLEEVDLCGAKLESCVVRNARLNDVRLLEGRLGHRFFGVHRARLRGDGISGKVIDEQSDEFVRVYLEEEADIWALEKQRPLIACVWRVLTNSGRSVSRLVAWTMAIWLFCGWLYAGLPVPGVVDGSAWHWLRKRVQPRVVRTCDPKGSISGFAPYYFSAITITTVGYGDIVPASDDWKAQVIAPAEGVLGLLAWGCLVTILLQRLQKRSA